MGEDSKYPELDEMESMKQTMENAESNFNSSKIPKIQMKSKRTTAPGQPKAFERLNINIFEQKTRSLSKERNKHRAEFGKPIELKTSKTKRALGER